MSAAAKIAFKKEVPVMLGDADVGPLLGRCKDTAVQTALDLLNPVQGGWRSLIDDFLRTVPRIINTTDVAQSKLLLDGEAPLSVVDLLRPGLLLGLPVSFVTYLLGFFIKAPIPFLIAVAYFTGVEELAHVGDDVVASNLAVSNGFDTPGLTSLFTFVFLVLPPILTNLVVLPRILLVEMLEKRNAQLARSIRRAASEQEGPVVAILGAAHVNDVARLLLSPARPDVDGLEDDGVWWAPPANVSKVWNLQS
jgi:hypothetical protein